SSSYCHLDQNGIVACRRVLDHIGSSAFPGRLPLFAEIACHCLRHLGLRHLEPPFCSSVSFIARYCKPVAVQRVLQVLARRDGSKAFSPFASSRSVDAIEGRTGPVNPGGAKKSAPAVGSRTGVTAHCHAGA